MSVKQGLEDQNWTVDWARDGEEGLYLVKNSAYDLALIDCMLPKMDGLTLAENIRTLKIKMAMIMMTAKGTLEDKIRGLELTDDYIVKPFEMLELIARVKTIYRRLSGVNQEKLEVGQLCLDLKTRSAKVSGQGITLTAKEFELIRLLATRAGEVFSRNDLSGLMYGYEDEPTSNSVDVLIARVRKKLNSSNLEIATVRSQGFILRVRVL